MMSDAIYKKDLLKLASDTRHAGPMADADATIVHDNIRCGDRCTLHVKWGLEKRIAAVTYEVRACILVQGSSAILAEQAKGANKADLLALREAVTAMLVTSAPPPAAPWEAYRVFAAAADQPARHACVLLPIEAALLAFDDEAKT